MSVQIIYAHTTDISSNSTSLTFVVANALSLARQGAKVTLMVKSSGAKGPLQLIRDRWGITDLPEHFELLTHRNRLPGNWGFYGFVKRIVSKIQDPVVLITRSHGVLKALAESRKSNHLLFFETHDFYFDLTKRPTLKESQRRKKSAIEKTCLPQVDGLICLNDPQRQLFQKYLDNVDIRCFPTGLELGNAGLPRRNRLLYIGSLNARLGMKALANVAMGLRKDIEMIIVGGKSKEEIDRFAALIPGGIPPNVTVTGWINKTELSGYCASGKVALLPLTDTFFNRYLTVPLKLLDYMSFGLPTVASRFPSTEAFIEDQKTGIFVDWEDTDKVLTLLEDLLDDDHKWGIMSENVLKEGRKLTWDTRASSQLTYFEEKLRQG